MSDHDQEHDQELAGAPETPSVARSSSMFGAVFRTLGATLSAGVGAYAQSAAQRTLAKGAARSRGSSGGKPPCTPCAARAMVAQARASVRGRGGA